MNTTVVSYIACLLVLLGLDMIWLTTTREALYEPAIGSLLAAKPNYAAIAVFYLLYPTGVVFFAIQPGLADGEWPEALLKGALFGFFCYATYDLTNMATLKTWSLTITLADIAWGTILTGTSAAASFFITRLIAH